MERQQSLDVVVDGLSHRFGGGISYLTGLLPALAREPGIGRVRLIVEPGAQLERTLAGSPVEIEHARLRPREGLLPRAVWEATVLPRITREAVVVAPAAMLPRRLHVPTIAVPHNALPFQQGGARNVIQKGAIRRTLGWADGCIFVSGYMRDLVLDQVSAPPVVEVVHHGIAAPFLADAPAAERRDIVCVADAYPHKRLDLVVAAWRRLGPDRPPLRLIGRDMGGAPAAEEGLEIIAHLDAQGVADALRRARVAVLASTSESFGLPAVEALAVGAPLVASDIPAYREVTGGHATLVASGRAEDWAAALARAADGPDDPAAVAWARAFTWERAAGLTAEVVARVSGRTATQRPLPPAYVA